MENIIEEKKSTYTPALKKAIYKWRETHPDKFREYSNKWSIDNYYKNADKYKEYARKKYREKQELEGKEIRPRGRPRKNKENPETLGNSENNIYFKGLKDST